MGDGAIATRSSAQTNVVVTSKTYKIQIVKQQATCECGKQHQLKHWTLVVMQDVFHDSPVLRRHAASGC